MTVSKSFALAVVFALLLSCRTFGAERLTIWGAPPREKPHMTKAAEGVPPLPLPAVPQRRTEKKRPPAAPKLIANVSDISFVGWQGSPGAVDELLRGAQRQLKLWYGWEQVDIASAVRKHAAGADYRTPIFYLCCYYPLNLSQDQREALRSYVLGGGTMLVNCCGQAPALASVKAELEQMFPKYQLRLLPLDHPIYHSCYELDQVHYPAPSSNALDEGAVAVDRPRLQGLTLGTRAAVIVSFEDLASGWNHWNNPSAQRVSPDDATKIGLNLVTYIAAEQRLASFLAKTKEISGPSVRPRQQVAFVQLVHDGNWNPNPSAVPFFLKELGSNTSVAVRFERKTIELKNPALFDYPLLYMTGSWDPNLSPDEIALLRRYLSTGGTLLVDAASGRQEFDQAFRALCQKVFPDSPLSALPAGHPLFQCFHKIDKLHLNQRPDPVAPLVETVLVNDRPAIYYSRYGLSDGWAHEFSSYANAYTTEDALKLGTNLVVFTMQ